VYTQTPFFVRFRSLFGPNGRHSFFGPTGRYSSRFAPAAGASWLLMVPGISLILLALAIVLWPELLAYLVAGAILTAGLVLTAWGWAMRQATRRQAQQVEYKVYPGGPY
jgi:hypothetical protein